MKKKGVLLILLGCFFILSSCVTTPKDNSPKQLEPGKGYVYGGFFYAENDGFFNLGLIIKNVETQMEYEFIFPTYIGCVTVDPGKYQIIRVVARDTAGGEMNSNVPSMNNQNNITEFNVSAGSGAYIGDFYGYKKVYSDGTYVHASWGIKNKEYKFQERTEILKNTYVFLAEIPTESVFEE